MDLLVYGCQHNFVSSNNPPKCLVNAGAMENLLGVMSVYVLENTITTAERCNILMKNNSFNAQSRL